MMRQAAVVGGWVGGGACCVLHGLGVGVGRAHQRSLHHTNLRAQTKPYIQLGPALASAGAGSDGWQTANRLVLLLVAEAV